MRKVQGDNAKRAGEIGKGIEMGLKEIREQKKQDRPVRPACLICGKPVWAYEESVTVRTSRKTTNIMHRRCVEEEKGKNGRNES